MHLCSLYSIFYIVSVRNFLYGTKNVVFFYYYSKILLQCIQVIQIQLVNFKPWTKHLKNKKKRLFKQMSEDASF